MTFFTPKNLEEFLTVGISDKKSFITLTTGPDHLLKTKLFQGEDGKIFLSVLISKIFIGKKLVIKTRFLPQTMARNFF